MYISLSLSLPFDVSVFNGAGVRCTIRMELIDDLGSWRFKLSKFAFKFQLITTNSPNLLSESLSVALFHKECIQQRYTKGRREIGINDYVSRSSPILIKEKYISFAGRASETCFAFMFPTADSSSSSSTLDENGSTTAKCC